MSAPIELAFAAARERVRAAARPLPPVVTPLAAAVGRALRADVRAGQALPAFDNAAMDGWAVRAADLAGAGAAPVELPVVAAIPAGRVAPRALAAGEAMRIMTGAAMPAGADAVLPFEQGERLGAGADERMAARAAVAPGENVRPAGRDLAAGALALAAGRELSAHDLALLVALDEREIVTGPAPRVALFTTGDELLEPGEPSRPGSLRDSNRPMLAELVREAGGVVVDAARLPDDPARVAERIDAALAIADVVLTVGGVSAGDHDPVKLALDRVGDIELWRVAMRPGRPQAFGTPRGRLFFGLPGNPGSAAVVFEVMVRPALRALQGFAELDRPRVPVRMATAIASRAGRTDLLRCTLEWREGSLWATPAGAQVSGHLVPQARAHALAIVPEAAATMAPGDAAEALLLRLPPA